MIRNNMKKSVKKVKKKNLQTKLSERVKNFSASDVALIKLAVFAFTLWLVGVLPLNYLLFVLINRWMFFAVFVLASIRPMIKFFQKKK